jgi:hypothetical protein
LGVIRIFLRTFPFHEIELFIPKVTHKLISRTSANPTFRGCKVFAKFPNTMPEPYGLWLYYFLGWFSMFRLNQMILY